MPPIESTHSPTKSTEYNSGINVAPGSHDDGWHAPEPVLLADETRIQLYKDGEALLAMYQAIEHAQYRICLEVYIFASDETGQAFAKLLSEKARQGVQVYVIYDSFGSMGADRQMFHQMSSSGVRLQEFHPIWPWKTNYGWRPFNRDHRKLLIVDNTVAGTGGLNIANEYAGPWIAPDKAKGSYWRDNGVGIVGPGAAMLLGAFARTWRYINHGGRIGQTEYIHNIGSFTPLSRPIRYSGMKKFESRRAQTLARRPTFSGTHAGYRGALLSPQDQPSGQIGVLASAPTISSPLWRFFSRLMREAKHNIYITMAYFAPSDELVNELCSASLRGVKVQIILPAHSDVSLLVIAARSFYQRLMSAGVKIYERQGAVLHAKTLLIDDEVVLMGSINLDYRSVEYNCEISVLIRNRTFGANVHDLFENDILYSILVDPAEFRARPMRDRIVQWAVNQIRSIL